MGGRLAQGGVDLPGAGARPGARPAARPVAPRTAVPTGEQPPDAVVGAFERVGAKGLDGVEPWAASEYPELDRDYAYVDAFTQWIVRGPEHYNVVVAPNMFGDIITDLAAVLQGGMGFAAGANVGTEHAMFEPVHGSSPKHAGKNQVNPFATFFAVEQMLRWLGVRHRDARLLGQADRLEQAIARTLAAGSARTYDQGGTVTTSEAGDRVAEAVREGHR